MPFLTSYGVEIEMGRCTDQVPELTGTKTPLENGITSRDMYHNGNWPSGFLNKGLWVELIVSSPQVAVFQHGAVV
jgi:hypothetical protein